MRILLQQSCIFLLLFFAGTFNHLLLAQDQALKAVYPAGYKSKNLPYSPAVLAGNTLYVSGQGSLNGAGNMPEDFRGQFRQALQNLQNVLRGTGMDFGNIVWLNVYLTDMGNLSAMNQVYWNTIGANPPARTILQIAALPAGQKVEINCIAVADTHPRREIWPSGWKRGPHIDPPAILAGDVLYISAQGDSNPLTGKRPSDFPGEVKQALDNVGEVLKAANMSYKNVVWVNPYMEAGSRQSYGEMNKVYATYFEFGDTPGRGTINVAGLPNGEHIVFSCIAGADLAKRKAVKPRNMPPSPTASPGVLYGNTLYLSAKDGFIPGQGLVTSEFDLQLRQSMRNLLDGLEEADMDFSNVVWSTVYLRGMQDYGPMNGLYKTFFQGMFPARTTLQQNFETGVPGAEQISVIAVGTKPAK
ncbi:MAG: RidA family protein [Acidobacteria bacterium]|nr:MAG: RidA family protein [Acidobacteriota bacterium]